MPEDWNHYRQVLVEASKEVFRRFKEKHASKQLIAIGYVFELWNASPQFDLCANVGAQHDQREEIRWNSGDYMFPAGLLGVVDELGEEWQQIMDRLHQSAEDQQANGEIYRGLITICCDSMAELANSGEFSNPLLLDFNVSEVNDNLDKVIARNHSIHEQLTQRLNRI